MLDLCFEEKTKINLEEFSAISEKQTSDMVLAVLSLLRERLPCSENYWRYKRNYEMHMRLLSGESQSSPNGAASGKPASEANIAMAEESKSDGSGAVKKLAKAHMSFVMPLSPYNQDKDGFFRMDGQSEGNHGSRPSSPNQMPAALDSNMNEADVANNIPLSNLKSNQDGQKEVFLDINADMAEQ